MTSSIELEIPEKPSLHENQHKTTFSPSEDEINPRFKSQIERSNIFSRLNFIYAWKLVLQAFKAERKGKSITSQDLVTFPWKNRADVLADRFSHYLKRQKKKPSLTLAILQAIKWPFLWYLFIQTIFSFSRIFSGWVMKKLIDCYIYPDVYGDNAYKWAGVLSATFVIAFYTQHHFDNFVMSFPNHIQNALTNIIYNKIIKLSMFSLTQISSGKLINLASNDISILEQRSMFFTNTIVGIIALIAGGAVLWQFFGVCCLVGLGYLIIWPPLQELAFILSHQERERTTEITDNRIRLTSETVENIRLLKMYTWELKFKEKIAALRKAEVKLLRKGGIVQAMSDAISFSSLPCASFLMYLAYFYTGGELTVSTVFASYFILGFLRAHASFFLQLGLGFATEIKLVLNRIEKVLEELEVGDVAFKEPLFKENTIEFDNYTAYWTAPPQSSPDRGTKLVDNDHPVLSNINLHIKKGSLNALVGTVSSGKTSLLHSFTGEIPRYTGTLRCKGSFAYVEQEPTIFAGTIRDNVLFGKPYDEAYYAKVVKACNLENDLKMFPKGDMSELVGGGNNLSGGQKARIALARAVYADADIYLLDDPLSAVDPKVARSLYNHAIEGVLKGKTVILVTHQVDFAVRCENIIVMEGGQVVGTGTYEELRNQNIQVLERLFGKAKKNTVSEEPEEIHHQHHVKEIETVLDGENQAVKKQKGAKEEDLYDGKVTSKTYLTLFKEMGGTPVIIAILLSCLACEMCNVAYGRMLGAWLSDTFAAWKTLAIIGGLVGFNILIHLVKFLIVAMSLSRAAKSLHTKMLNRIIQATVLFFDMNSVGQIVTRFSNDLGALDRFFPLAVNDITIISFMFGSMAVTVTIIDPVLIAPIASVFIFTEVMLWICYPAVKQTKYHELGTKDPLFGLFSATLSGITIIRIYNQGEAFKQRFQKLLHDTMKGSVAYSLAGRVMGFYCDMAYVIAVIVSIFIITARSVGDAQRGYLAAFSLSLILSLTGILQHGLRQLTQLNIFMSATARIHAYSKVPSEPELALSTDDSYKNDGWPQRGKIDFNKVYMKYRPDADYVIRDLNLDVKSGQKVGCVGRTGAGKTTIVQLMYRMREIDKQLPGTEDSYIKIDDVNTQSLGLHLLRNNVSVIPQSPVIFSGTIRMNIDPLGEFSDEEIWKVLGDVRLKDHVEKQKSKLDTHINTGSSVFSVGQKQLVCLGRAILRPSNILIMDEATANMDEDTDSFLQTTIKQKFAHSTQFTIAHRLATIASYDRVLVLDKGRRVEFDEPYRLLVKNIGDEHFTNPEGYFTRMVLNTGPITSKKIFEIARNSHFERSPNERK